MSTAIFRTPSMQMLALSLLLLSGPGPAAQDLALRAGSWARAAQLGRSDEALVFVPAFEFSAAQSRLLGPAVARPGLVTLVGVRYRMSEQHVLFADTASASGLGSGLATTHLGTKLGLEWKPARSALGFEHGALGVQLDSGYRLSLRSRHGGAGIYLRNSF